MERKKFPNSLSIVDRSLLSRDNKKTALCPIFCGNSNGKLFIEAKCGINVGNWVRPALSATGKIYTIRRREKRKKRKKKKVQKINFGCVIISWFFPQISPPGRPLTVPPQNDDDFENRFFSTDFFPSLPLFFLSFYSYL